MNEKEGSHLSEEITGHLQTNAANIHRDLVKHARAFKLACASLWISGQLTHPSCSRREPSG